MSRYERVNLMARLRATAPMSGQAQVHEWEVRTFDASGTAANAAFYTSRRDAERDMARAACQGRRQEGPFPRGPARCRAATPDQAAVLEASVRPPGEVTAPRAIPAPA